MPSLVVSVLATSVAELRFAVLAPVSGVAELRLAVSASVAMVLRSWVLLSRLRLPVLQSQILLIRLRSSVLRNQGRLQFLFTRASNTQKCKEINFKKSANQYFQFSLFTEDENKQVMGNLKLYVNLLVEFYISM